MRIDKIFFGNADGETESKKKDFVDLFYVTEESRQICKEPTKFIIYGQKGTGKTLLAKYIEKEYAKKNGIVSKMITDQQIKLTSLIETNDTRIQDTELTVFYEWVLLREFAKLIFENKIRKRDILKNGNWKYPRKVIAYFKAYNELERILDMRYSNGNYEANGYYNLEKTGYNTRLTMADMFFSCNSQFEQGAERKTDFLQKPYYKMIEEIENLIITCLQLVNVVIILDDLDEFDGTLETDKEKSRSLVSLINSVKLVNSKIHDSGRTKSKCIVVIRHDILKTINKHSSNLNKLIADSGVFLYWLSHRDEKPESHPIMQMIINKVKISCEEFATHTDAEIYKYLFPDMVDGKEPIYYLLDYSLGRPRDVINYLNIVQRKYPEESCFKGSMLRDCRVEYSTLFEDELYNEIHVLHDKEYIRELLQLLKDFKHRTFFYNQIEAYYKNHADNYSTIDNLKNGMQVLYSLGIVGNSYKSERGVNFTWAYRIDGSESMDIDKKFTVHYGIRKRLGM